MARSPTSTIPAADTRFLHGWQWAVAGVNHIRRDPPLWIGMSAWYLIPVTLLAHIPFAGMLLVVLLSPMVLAGMLLAAAHPASGSPRTVYRRWITRPGRELLRALADPVHAYPTVLLAIVTLGLMVIVFIIEHLFGLGSFSALRSAASLGTRPSISLFVGVLVACVLQALLLMALFYSLHRVLFAKRDPLAAMEESFKASLRHVWALAGLVAFYFIPYLLIAVGFSLSRTLGYVLLLTIGLAALPALVAATYRSYREVFPSPTPG